MMVLRDYWLQQKTPVSAKYSFKQAPVLDPSQAWELMQRAYFPHLDVHGHAYTYTEKHVAHFDKYKLRKKKEFTLHTFVLLP